MLDLFVFSKIQFKISIETITQKNLIKLNTKEDKINLFNKRIKETEEEYENGKYENCFRLLKTKILDSILIRKEIIGIDNSKSIMEIFKKNLKIDENSEWYKYLNSNFKWIAEIRNGIEKGEKFNKKQKSNVISINKEWNKLDQNQKKLITRLFIDNTKTLFNFLLEAKLLKKYKIKII